MTIIKPARLAKGDVIGIAAPASPPKSVAKLSRGIHYLERLGYHVLTGKHVNDKYGYLAGPDEARANDLNELFADPRVKAIIAARGGYGANRILPYIDYDLIRRNPKIFVGYSDITALQLAIFKMTGLVTISGPMVATEFGGKFGRQAEEHFWRCLTSTQPLGLLKNPGRKKPRTLRTGNSVGQLLGGNLSMITSLLGTSYMPPVSESVLVLEEVDEPPYKVDRMLHHLKLAGVFSQCSAVALGDFTTCRPSSRKTPSLTIPQILNAVFSDGSIPIVTGLHYGHVKGSLTLPFGIPVRLDASKGGLEFLESAVQ